MSEELIPLGIRLTKPTADHLQVDARRKGTSRSAHVRAIVEAHYAERPSGGVKPDTLPRMYGTKEASAVLGTTTSNLWKVAGLPEPLYARQHPNPARRLSAGSFYDADAIDMLAEQRRTGSGTLLAAN